MSEVLDFIYLRGEYVSLFLVAGTLALSGKHVATLLRLPRSEVGDLFWNAGIAFVVVARLGFLVTDSPSRWC